MTRRVVCLAFLFLGTLHLAAIDAGVARIDVTPEESIRLTGYGNRRTNHVGVEQRLWAKALALGSDREGPVLLLTLDNCGVTEAFYKELVSRLIKRTKLKPGGIALACSHTHSAPATTDWAPNIFSSDIVPEQQAVIDRYTRGLLDKLEQVGRAALKDRKPAQLSWAQGEVGFARNRRVVVGNTANFGDNAAGPVDHALPVLRVTDPDGKLRALVANYAAHCTTLGGEFNHIHGDWAGYAQEAIERDHPGATALITIGCGADANPSPRGTLALTKQHGEALAAEVKRLLGLTFTPLSPSPLNGERAGVRGENFKITTGYKEIHLPFGQHYTRAEWQQRTTNSGIVGYHARKWLARLDRGEKPPDSLYYPINTWRFGDDLAMVFLPGEVVVDYALRLKKEFDPQRLWVTAYANYVPCYIPSRRILAEGGYEAEGSLWYYDRPARISTNAEDLIIKTVHELVPKTFRVDPKKAEFPDPLAPKQALGTFRTKENFTVELVASEPLIASPVAIDWDARGRLWVCEMYDYPTGIPGKVGQASRLPRERASASSASGASRSSASLRSAGAGGTPALLYAGHEWGKNPPDSYAPGGRIKILTSSKGDGRYDKATLFLDKLSFPTGVFPWRNGALICAAPDILYAEDTDGDGRADVVRTNFTGFATHNYQARVNGFRWGLDGWLHGSSGLFGGKIKSLLTGKEVDLGGRDFRIKPDTGEIEPLAGISQFGRVRDDFDNWFGNDNSTLLWHYPLAEHYMRRNPHVAYPDPRVSVAADVRRLTSTRKGDQSLLTSAATDPNRVFPISRTLERFNHPESANRVTSACGIDIYRDNLLGAEYYGNAFICEPVHNLVTRLVLEPDGVTFAGRRAVDEQRGEFLASTDNWFRPVQVRTGPDGALWVVDMYRFVIEHPRWIAPDRLKTLDVRAGADKGRIYRVYPKGAKLRPIRDLTKLDESQLVEALETPNGTTRDQAHHELIAPANAQRTAAAKDGTPGAVPMAPPFDHSLQWSLIRLVTNSPLPAVRAQAMFTSVGMSNGFNSYFWGVNDTHPEVRRLAVQLTERERVWTPIDHWNLLSAINYSNPRVRFQLALSHGELFWFVNTGGGLVELIQDGDPWIRAAVLSSSTNYADTLFDEVSYWPVTNRHRAALLRDLISTAAGTDGISLLHLMSAMTDWNERALSEWRLSSLATLVESLERNGHRLDVMTHRGDDWAKVSRRIKTMVGEASAYATNSSFAEEQRATAVRLVSVPGAAGIDGVPVLLRLLHEGSPRLRQAALAALRRQGDAEIPKALLGEWSLFQPSLRPELLNLILSRDAWLQALLSAVRENRIVATELSTTQRERLLKHKDAAIRRTAEELLGSRQASARSKAISEFQSATSLFQSASADFPISERGAALFDKHCAQCHAWRGHGHAVGPNLAEYAGKGVADFVLAILDPNAAINPNFLAYNVETKDGRSLTGIVRGETASGLTLVQGGGVEEKILRGDIAEIRASALSMMPEGLEQALSPQDMADLIAWLKQGAPAPFGHASANPDLAARNRADFLKSGASGVAKVVSAAETLPYRSWIGTWPMAYCRQSAGVNRLAWEAERRAPARRESATAQRAEQELGAPSTVAFRFPAAMGFVSQPQGHFTLHLNGKPVLDFDVALADATWSSADGRVRMSYSVAEANAEDSSGPLTIEVDTALLELSKPARFEVAGSESGSQRWFGIYKVE